MAELKKIKIFLASSVSEQDEPELVADRNKLGAFCNQLNTHFINHGLFFHLIDCTEYDRSIAEGGKQAQLDKDIKDSALIFFLFFTKVGEYTRHEFDIALDSYRERKQPKIVTFFRYRNSPDEAEGKVKAFKEELDSKYKHYYNIYNSIDTLKLGMLMQILSLQLDDGAFSPSVENGTVQFANISVGSTENIPMFSNTGLAKLRDELKNTTREYLDYQEAYLENGENDSTLYEEYCALASKKAELEEQLRHAEEAVLSTAEDLYKKTSDGTMTEKLIRAYRAFEQGKTVLAREILNFDEILRDTKHAAQMADKSIDRLQAHVNELLFRAQLLKSETVTKKIAEEIEKAYNTAYEFIMTYNLNKAPLYDYAVFLETQNEYEKAMEVATASYNWNEYAKKIAKTSQAKVTPLTDYEAANLSNLLGVLYKASGLFSQAEKAYNDALEAFRHLACLNPNVYNFDVSITLNNLATLYLSSGQVPKADKVYNDALKLLRELAYKNPDAYGKYLTATLNNLANLYINNNNRLVAEKLCNEALAICRKLVTKNPDVYNFEIATTLNNLATLHGYNGQLYEAEKLYNEAISIRRELAAKNPDAYNPILAISLSGLACLYLDYKRYDEAEKTYNEVLSIRRKLAAKNPDVYGIHLAVSLFDLGKLYQNTNRHLEAESLYDEAVVIYRKLAKKSPDAYNGNLANTLDSLGLIYSDDGLTEQAKKVWEEALEIYRKLVALNPDDYNNFKLATILCKLGMLYNDDERYMQAEKMYTEAISIYRPLALRKPDEYNNNLAVTLDNLAELYFSNDRVSEAEKNWNEAISLFRKLVATDPDKYNDYLACTLNNLATLYDDNGENKKAEKLWTEVITIYRNLSATDPEYYRFCLAGALSDIGFLYYRTDQVYKSEDALNEAFEIYSDLAVYDPDKCYPKVAVVLYYLAGLYSDNERIWGAEIAEEYYNKAYEIALEYRQTSSACRRICENIASDNRG